MPEPLLYLKATGAAAIVSAIIVLAVLKSGRENSDRREAACGLAIGLGLVVGYYLLELGIAWPPRNGLDRFLMLIMPTAVGIELIAALPITPVWLAWLMRIALAALLPRILLHGSVYLVDWTFWQAGGVTITCLTSLAVCWILLARLSNRGPGVSIPLALCLSLQCAAMTVMMAGYIKGGAVAFPIIATLATATITASIFTDRFGSLSKSNAAASIGIGVIGLFGVLFIGRFFGRISSGVALVFLFAPLLCWATELSALRHRKPWVVGSLRLALVAIPLIVVLALAKRDFDRDMSPLLNKAESPQIKLVVSTQGKVSG